MKDHHAVQGARFVLDDSAHPTANAEASRQCPADKPKPTRRLGTRARGEVNWRQRCLCASSPLLPCAFWLRSASAESPPVSEWFVDFRPHYSTRLRVTPMKTTSTNKSTLGWRERLAQLPPEQQQKVKALMRETVLLRRREARREAVELILRLQRDSRRRLLR